jgi:hypothetical protein
MIQKISKNYRVQIRVGDGRLHPSLRWAAGLCSYSKRVIYVSKDGTKQKRINTIFHELGHIYCFDNNLWTRYHYNKHWDELTVDDAIGVIRTGLKAERWIESWAESEQKKWYPNMKYEVAYYKPHNVKKYREKYLINYYNLLGPVTAPSSKRNAL